MSTGVSGDIIGAGGVLLVAALSEDSKRETSDRYEDIKVKTREWKCGLEIGLVSMSYCNHQHLFSNLGRAPTPAS